MSLRTKLMRNSIRLYYIVIIFSFLWLEADAKKSKHRKRRGKKVGGGLRTFRNISIFFFFILFTPSLLTFLNSLRKDPAVPQLVTATKEWFKKRSFSFLGGRTSSPNGDHTYDNPNRFSVEEKYS
mmetsp:Transcript_23694/g.53471  ORF Transcript_23694/g.53471 Transcript_23694/m.53471 type:complete len:125 (-) Transcript_23694:351-725(-)